MKEGNGLPPATKATFAAADDDVVVTLDDIERLANASLNPRYFVYYNCGAEQEQTLRENKSAFMRLRLRPRVLMGVAVRNTEVTLLGDQKLSLPVGISPTAAHTGAHPDGEVATAKECEDRNGSEHLLWHLHRRRPERGPDGLRWFQLSIYKDRDFTRSLVERAEQAGFKALVMTVDVPVPGLWIKMRKAASNSIITVLGAPGMPRAETWNGLYRDVLDASVTWDDVTWLKSISKLPVIAKGILTAEDAEEAVKHGVSAILASNHGGRQLDGVPSTIEALPEVVRAVRGRVEVYVDGGVRRGTDVVKALALGARAVFVGRPVLWGLASLLENFDDGKMMEKAHTSITVIWDILYKRNRGSSIVDYVGMIQNTRPCLKQQ
ncbi:hydroxyacid oxidase 1 [Ixodes scapularis]